MDTFARNEGEAGGKAHFKFVFTLDGGKSTNLSLPRSWLVSSCLILCVWSFFCLISLKSCRFAANGDWSVIGVGVRD